MRWVSASLDPTYAAHDTGAVFGYVLPPMLHINDLTYRIEGRVIFDKASAGIPAGHKVGFVGRNGSGKTTLLRLIAGELQPDDGGINVPRATRIGWVTQEAPGGPESLLEVVLSADKERARLLAEAETAHDPGRIADIHERLGDIGAHAAPSRAARILAGLGFDEAARREKQRLDLKLKKKQDDERRHIEAFITRFKAKASKASQAQSRVKALARMQPIAEQIAERVAPFVIPNPAKALASPLIRLEGVSVGYVPDSPVLQGLDLRLDADDRVGLLGANGNGKSTFAKLVSGRLPAMTGKRYASDKIVVGYFAQHQMDDLPAGKTPYQHMLDLMPDATEAQRR